MKKDGKLVVVSGFSGSGKGSLIRKLIEEYGDYVLSVSMTTRAPRRGERHGREYFFVTRAEFEEAVEAGALLEHAEFVGNCYGTPRAYVEEELQKGNHVMLEIDVQGGMQIRRTYPDAFLLFLVPPSAAILEERLRGRGTETEEQIADRLRRALEETAYMSAYDMVIVNDDLDACAARTDAILRGEESAPAPDETLIARFRKELIDRLQGQDETLP